MTFQRARSDEQREIRRRAILDTAATMLDEMPVAEVSLNELSRRVGLAKSNVLRYFESREAILLELLVDFQERWLAEVTDQLSAGIEVHATPEIRATQLADVLSTSLAKRVVLCDLFGAQGGVLERNISIEVAKRHKRASLAMLTVMADLIRRHLPELGGDAELFCLTSFISAGALSAYVPPPPSLLAAYADEPALGALNWELRDALRYSFKASLVGVLPRA
ncbi:TetR/AcrR family transcriptional regulator [Rhodococcoides yunnanense]|uniref:TetR family transcriptional regulator n=1 Tax=Rhodococcoides yunnanense TaxID=278209 RepID=A0ABU4B7X4_9NOCA|nr:TetR family transcriptional regulator [Rhodococcus yunnanensis]MDV6260258.1 TetR family transcriptional regulator [Rhodococcus yunnanensis]